MLPARRYTPIKNFLLLQKKKSEIRSKNQNLQRHIFLFSDIEFNFLLLCYYNILSHFVLSGNEFRNALCAS